MSQTILVGYDGSQAADRAAERACEFAARIDARVVLVFTARLDGPPYEFPMVTVGDPVGDLMRYGEHILASEKEKLGRWKVPVQSEVLSGVPAEMLARRAEPEDVAYVVVGRSGKGAVSRVLLGSVSNRLAHICPKPLLVVP